MSVSDQLNNDGDNTNLNANLSTDGNQNLNTNQNNQNSDANNQSALNTSSLILSDKLQGLVGEGKKYSTVQSALDSIVPAQDHISKLEQEAIDGLKQVNTDDQSSKLTVDDLEKVLTKLAPNNQDSNDSGLSAQDVEALLQAQLPEILNTREAQQEADVNQGKFTKLLNEKYGSKALETYDQLVKDTGLSKEKIDSLVRSNPDFIIKHLPTPNQTTQMTGSNTNTNQMQAHGDAAEWSQEWINNIRRNEPKRYYGPKFQVDLLTKRE